MSGAEWERLEQDVVGCKRCPRLIDHCRETARIKRRMYRDEVYWGRPVPGFGDRSARILFLGLAPGAHGANRTGRMFTGDASGEWLYSALHRAGLADRPASVSRDDSLRLGGAYISNVCRCAPPSNKPIRDELENCRPFLDREFDALRRLRVVVALGKIAWDAALRRARSLAPASFPKPAPPFGHGAETPLTLRRRRPPVALLGCYHPSRQNTQTGRLTRSMLDAVVRRAERLAEVA
jgi:uracil-DNA glycosylase family 4